MASTAPLFLRCVHSRVNRISSLVLNISAPSFVGVHNGGLGVNMWVHNQENDILILTVDETHVLHLADNWDSYDLYRLGNPMNCSWGVLNSFIDERDHEPGEC